MLARTWIAALLLAVGGDGVELAPNGGFEEDLAGFRAAGMQLSTRLELDDDERADGRRSLRVERTGKGMPDFVKWSAELPAGASEVRFALSWKVAEGRGAMTVYFADARGDFVGRGEARLAQVKESRRFERAEETFEVPAGATHVGFNLRLDQPATLWLDEVSVRALGAPSAGPLEVANGDFEAGIGGWSALAGSGTTAVEIAPRTGSERSAALVLERASARRFPLDGVRARVADLGKARRAVLRARARAEGGAAAVVLAQVLDERGVPLATERQEVAGEEWAEVELALALGRDAVRLEVFLCVRGAGRALFDDVVLSKR